MYLYVFFLKKKFIYKIILLVAFNIIFLKKIDIGNIKKLFKLNTNEINFLDFFKKIFKFFK